MAMALYLAGLLFKETAVTLPGLLFLAEWLVLNAGSLKGALRRAWRYAAYAVPLAVYLAMRANVSVSGMPVAHEATLGASSPVRLLHASGVMLRYLGQMVFPVWMSADYADYANPVRAAAADPVALASVFVWPVLAVVVWCMARRRHWVPLFGIAWFVASILPTSNILFPIGTIRADRLLYLPSAGFCLLAAWYVCALPDRARRGALVAACIWIAALSARAVVRNADWQSTASLWSATLKTTPGSWTGWGLIGDLQRDNGETTAALESYTRAIELRAKLGILHPEASNNRAQMLKALNRTGEAAEVYHGVLKAYPQNFVALLNLGELSMREPSRLPEALDLLRRAVQVRDKDFRGHVNLAQALFMDRQTSAALASVDRAIELGPAERIPHELKAHMRETLGRKDEAKAARARGDELRRGPQSPRPQ